MYDWMLRSNKTMPLFQVGAGLFGLVGFICASPAMVAVGLVTAMAAAVNVQAMDDAGDNLDTRRNIFRSLIKKSSIVIPIFSVALYVMFIVSTRVNQNMHAIDDSIRISHEANLLYSAEHDLHPDGQKWVPWNALPAAQQDLWRSRAVAADAAIH